MTDDSTTDLKTDGGDDQAFVKPAEKPQRKAAARKGRKTGRKASADVARTLGLDEGIKLGAVGAPERLRKSVLGDICEAVIGAIFIDGGYQAAAEFVERAWSDRLRKPMRALRDPKTVLQEWAQGRGLPTPTYREIERTGPQHEPRFRIE